MKSSFVISVTESSSLSFVLFFPPSVLLFIILLVSSSFPFDIFGVGSLFSLSISSSLYFLAEIGLFFSLSFLLSVMRFEFSFSFNSFLPLKILFSLFFSFCDELLISRSLLFSPR